MQNFTRAKLLVQRYNSTQHAVARLVLLNHHIARTQYELPGVKLISTIGTGSFRLISDTTRYFTSISPRDLAIVTK